MTSLFVDEEAEAPRDYNLPKVTCNSYMVTAGWELYSAPPLGPSNCLPPTKGP